MLEGDRKPKGEQVLRLAVLAVFASSGCASILNHSGETMTGNDPAYFRTPMEAVEILSNLLSASDWKTVARYYDLSGTGIRREELESGRFFLPSHPPRKPPFMRNPGIRRPFAPGFKYERHTLDGRGNVSVYLKMEIDQGGGMTQRSLSAFKMRKSGSGYQLLPEEVSYFD